MFKYLIVSLSLLLISAEWGRCDGLEASTITKVVILGTGTPNTDPGRSGPGVAIVVNDAPYIVDFGAGIVRRAADMTPAHGRTISALEPKRLNRAFLTHLHSDHTVGYPDLILTPWTLGRDEPLEVYGPEGIEEMTVNLLKAYDADIKYRLYGSEPANNNGWHVNAHVVSEGIVYRDENITVEAFPVLHGTWPNAFGYRFTTPDRVIVISGDTRQSANIEKYSKDADILVHEVYAQEGFDKRTPEWQAYHRRNHTSAVELGDIAERANVKLLVLYHILFFGSTGEQILEEVRSGFDGEVVLANDLDVF